MAGSKWDFETGAVATGIGAAFAGKDGKPPENPFDGREKRPLTDEEKADLERANEMERQVNLELARARFNGA